MKPLVLDLRSALLLVLDQVDYLHGACSITDPVGGALPADVIELAHASIDKVPPLREVMLAITQQASFDQKSGTVTVAMHHMLDLVALAGLRGIEPVFTGGKVRTTHIQD